MSDLINEMQQLGVLDRNRLELFYPRVRDRDDVAVLRDSDTGVIVLSRSDHIDSTYYDEKPEKLAIEVDGDDVLLPRLEDNIRRAEDFGDYIRNRRWLDVGCGLGGMLDEMATVASWAAGFEPNRDRASIVARKGHNVVTNLDDLEAASIDIVTLFHVLEHMTDPVGMLREIRRVLKPSGVILVEVPHARDVLFSLYDCEAFKRFTFWSEHLILHTRESLNTVLESAGFLNPKIDGYQRYPLANHLYWLAKGTGGGQNTWTFLNSAELDANYLSALRLEDRTDTLIATAINAQ